MLKKAGKMCGKISYIVIERGYCSNGREGKLGEVGVI
jgi:hypothetical protein